MDFIFINKEFAVETKNKILKKEGIWETVNYELRRKAEEAMPRGPWSVTWHESPAASGNPHDYYSEAPYSWPDPKDPNAPYISRDGERYPDRFIAHREEIEALAKTVMFLCYGGYYLEEKKYLERAVSLLRVWFLDPQTKMNPNLLHAQAIRNLYSGRNYGIIELKHVDQIVNALCFIGQYPDWAEEIEGMKQWLSQMLLWLTTSEMGTLESETGSNHATWWANHVATYAAFVGDDETLFKIFEFFKSEIIAKQMDDEGGFPRELKRTRPMHYQLSNLEGVTLLSEIAFYRGVDLWNYKTEDGKCMEKAIRFMLPFLDNPYLWKYKELGGEIPSDQLVLQLAALRLGIKEGQEINEQRGLGCYLVRYQEPMGPFILMPGHKLAK